MLIQHKGWSKSERERERERRESNEDNRDGDDDDDDSDDGDEGDDDDEQRPENWQLIVDLTACLMMMVAMITQTRT